MMEFFDAILVKPPKTGFWFTTEHLGIAYLTAVLRANGFRVKIIDAHLDELDTSATIRRIMLHPEALLVGFTVVDHEALIYTAQIAHSLREQSYSGHITIGGYFATFWAREILDRYEDIDSVVVGEGEVTLIELASRLKGNRSWKGIEGTAFRSNGRALLANPRPKIADLDSLPFPARDYLDRSITKGFPAVIYSSRGCPHRCSFCQVQEFYRMQPGSIYRARSAHRVVDEIEYLADTWGARYIFFVDDDFLGGGRASKERARSIAKEMIRRQLDIRFAIQCRVDDIEEELLLDLKKAGLQLLIIGIEAGVQRLLDSFNKQVTVDKNCRAARLIRDLDLQLIAGFIIADPYTTLTELSSTADFIEDCMSGAAPLIMDPLLILKGTEMETILRRDGLLKAGELGFDYKIRDPRVDTFVRVLIPKYLDICGRAINQIYQLYFLLGSCRESAIKERLTEALREIENAVREQNLSFLRRSVHTLKADDGATIQDLMSDFESAFQNIETMIAHHSIWREIGHNPS